jgi:hypothetical protein
MAHSQTNPERVWALDRFQFVNRGFAGSRSGPRLANGYQKRTPA